MMLEFKNCLQDCGLLHEIYQKIIQITKQKFHGADCNCVLCVNARYSYTHPNLPEIQEDDRPDFISIAGTPFKMKRN
jgi:hypothetical protein